MEDNNKDVENIKDNENIDYPLQANKKVESFITVEWENYFNDGFDIYSINNGIVQRRESNVELFRNLSAERIEFHFENGQEFSFKDHEDEKDISANIDDNNGPIIRSIDVDEPEKIFTEENKAENKQEDKNEKLIELMKVDNQEETIKDHNDINKEIITNIDSNNTGEKNNLTNENEKIEVLERDENHKEEFMNTSKPTEEINNKEIVDEVGHEFKQDPAKLMNNVEGIYEQDSGNKDDYSNGKIEPLYNFEDSPEVIESLNPHSTNEINEVFENKYTIKNKDKEIQNLNEKLNNQKYQNKIIIDENKKLLEIINIFKILQNIEKEPTKDFQRQSQIKLQSEISNLKIDQNDMYSSNKHNKITEKFDNRFENSESNISIEKPKNQEQNFHEEREIKITNVLHSNSPIKDKIIKGGKSYINTNKVKTTSYGALYKGKTKSTIGNDNKVNSSVNTSEIQQNIYKRKFLSVYNQTINSNLNDSLKDNTRTFKEDNYNKTHNESLSNNIVSIQKSKSSQRAQQKKVKYFDINQEKFNHENRNLYINNNETNIPSGYNIERAVYNLNYENYNRNSQPIDKENDKDEFERKSINNHINLPIQNNISNPNFEQIINLLEKYRDMNEKLISSLNKENFSSKIDIEKRKRDVEQLEKILDSVQITRESEEIQKHVIPFYLIDKRDLYENIVNYMYAKKERNSPYHTTKNTSTLTAEKKSHRNIKK